MMISVVIPFYNESETISETIYALKTQTVLPNEVIFIDSGSTDKTVEILKKHIIKTKEFIMKVIYSGKMSPSTSINLGIKSARNNMIMYIDCGLFIPNDWIESQSRLYKYSEIDLVSGKIFTKGQNLVDKSFIAHTYGYMNSRPCLTGSLFNREILKRTGILIDGVRAGYDTDFVKKIEENNMTRVINDINLEYYGINYADKFEKGFCKIVSYSKSSRFIESDNKPFLYIIFLLLGFLSIVYKVFTIYLSLYIIIRGFIVPLYKSNALELIKNFKLFLILPITAMVYDIARISGYLEAYIHRK